MLQVRLKGFFAEKFSEQCKVLNIVKAELDVVIACRVVLEHCCDDLSFELINPENKLRHPLVLDLPAHFELEAIVPLQINKAFEGYLQLGQVIDHFCLDLFDDSCLFLL